MFQAANIAASVTSLFRADANLPALVPGGMLYGMQKPPTSRPYASLSVIQDGEPEIASSGAKINLVTVTYQITILVWSNAQLGNAEAIQAALNGLIGVATKFTLLTNNAWTLENTQVDAPLIEEGERSNQANIFIAGATWLSQIQENRT